jgi:hypothetical protein
MPLSRSTKQWIVFGATWVLGVIFLAAAFLKGLDLAAFNQQIARYQILPTGFESPFAVGLIMLEGIAGLACIVTFRLRAALWLMIGLLTLFLVSTLFRWGLLQNTNCGCFGELVAGGPRAVVLHTAVLIALAAAVLVLLRQTIVSSSLKAWRIVGGGFAMFLLLFVASPFSQNAALSQGLTGDQTRVFLSATCEKCKREAEKVKVLANSADVPPVRVFIGATYEYQVNDYFREANLQVPYTPMTFSQLSRETPHVPKVQVFRGGNLVREWDGVVPAVDEVRRALSETAAK